MAGGVTVRLAVERNGDREGIVLEVSDTGIVNIISGCQFILSSNDNDRSSFLGVGILEEHLSCIFQRFYRVESQQSHGHHEGTGVGLALVKECVARHDGEISVKSQVNVGTTFRVWIPSGYDHLPQQQVYFKSKREKSKFDAEYENQINLNINLYLHERMQREQESESNQQPKEDDQHGIDNESLSSTSSPRLDEWSALHMEPSYVEFENTRKYILVVDDNADMRYVHLILFLMRCYNIIV